MRLPAIYDAGADDSAVEGRSTEVCAQLEVEAIRDGERFQALEGEWRELLESSRVNNIFLTWEWLYTWWQHLGGRYGLLLVTVRAQLQLIGVAPLAVSPAFPHRGLPFGFVEFIGSGPVGSDYLDIIARRGREPEVAAAVANYLTRVGKVVILSGVAADSYNISFLVGALAQSDWNVYRTPTDRCPYANLSGIAWDEYRSSFGKPHRELRRRKRRAAEEHSVRYRQVTCEGSRAESFADWVALHTKRWESAGGTQAVVSDDIRCFHDRFTAVALDRNWLRLSVLEFDDVPVAAAYGFVYGNKYYFYQTGYDPAFGRLSPGLMCLESSLKSAVGEGVEELDFLHGVESYKFSWARETRELVRYSCVPPGGRGAFVSSVLGGRRMVRRWLRRADALQEKKVEAGLLGCEGVDVVALPSGSGSREEEGTVYDSIRA